MGFHHRDHINVGKGVPTLDIRRGGFPPYRYGVILKDLAEQRRELIQYLSIGQLRLP